MPDPFLQALEDMAGTLPPSRPTVLGTECLVPESADPERLLSASTLSWNCSRACPPRLGGPWVCPHLPPGAGN